jgi:hypothetical protein
MIDDDFTGKWDCGQVLGVVLRDPITLGGSLAQGKKVDGSTHVSAS